MKKTMIVLVVAAILLLVSATAAFAAQNDSGYITAVGNPHQGYDTTTKKHHAGPLGDGLGSEALLQSTKAGACTYCHISNPPVISSKRVYGEVATNYTNESVFGHNSTNSPCIGCHQVHGAANAMTGNAYLDQKILIEGLTSIAGTSPNNALAGVATEVDNNTAVSRWCSGCHSYYITTENGASPVMTGTASGTRAWVASPQCKSCHNSSSVNGTVVASAFPHFTDGARFLTSADTSVSGSTGATGALDGQYDGVCLRCHVSNSTTGVGRNF
jgi:hypothetical protein